MPPKKEIRIFYLKISSLQMLSAWVYSAQLAYFEDEIWMTLTMILLFVLVLLAIIWNEKKWIHEEIILKIWKNKYGILLLIFAWIPALLVLTKYIYIYLCQTQIKHSWKVY